MAPQKWRVVSAENNQRLERMIDGNPNTVYAADDKTSQSVVIDLGEELALKGFTYQPRQDGHTEGIIYQYNFYVSEDGTQWKKVMDKATFANIKNNPVKQDVRFDQTQKARFIKLEALSSVIGDQQLSVAELGILTK